MRGKFKAPILKLLLIITIITVITFVIISGKSVNNTQYETIEISIAIKNHQFVPSIIEVPRGKKIRLIVHNQDNTAEEFESIDLHREKIILPNNSIQIIIAPLAPGKYNFFGDFHQDTAQGTLVVN